MISEFYHARISNTFSALKLVVLGSRPTWENWIVKHNGLSLHTCPYHSVAINRNAVLISSVSKVSFLNSKVFKLRMALPVNCLGVSKPSRKHHYDVRHSWLQTHKTYGWSCFTNIKCHFDHFIKAKYKAGLLSIRFRWYSFRSCSFRQWKELKAEAHGCELTHVRLPNRSAAQPVVESRISAFLAWDGIFWSLPHTECWASLVAITQKSLHAQQNSKCC